MLTRFLIGAAFGLGVFVLGTGIAYCIYLADTVHPLGGLMVVALIPMVAGGVFATIVD